MRPLLAPAARRVWRDADTLQISTSGGAGVLVQGLSGADRPLLTLLDGLRTREQVVEEALTAGCTTPERSLRALERAGLLVDADDLVPLALERERRDRLAPDVAALSLDHAGRARRLVEARSRARVVVHGAGRVGGPLAALLAEAGVGTVDVVDDGLTRPEDLAVAGLRPADLGAPRGATLARRLGSTASRRTPALVVLTGDAPVDVPRRAPLLRAAVDGNLGVVGPLVLPGRTPCLQCVELDRTAIDPLAGGVSGYRDEAVRAAVPCEGLLAVAVAAQAARQVLQHLAGGQPAAVGGTLELGADQWQWRRRTWPAHPACGCGAGRLADTA